mmetsp:Transcript_142902/g.252293  ORF Transcript_142902/g.252293 Transcript_142902/m.252293 type:complete len:291 (-) Transcript_142902:342-1214(-)
MESLHGEASWRTLGQHVVRSWGWLHLMPLVEMSIGGRMRAHAPQPRESAAPALASRILWRDRCLSPNRPEAPCEALFLQYSPKPPAAAERTVRCARSRRVKVSETFRVDHLCRLWRLAERILWLLALMAAAQKDLWAAKVVAVLAELRLVVLPGSSCKTIHNRLPVAIKEEVFGFQHSLLRLVDPGHALHWVTPCHVMLDTWSHSLRAEHENDEACHTQDAAAAVEEVASTETAHESLLVLLDTKISTEGHEKADGDRHTNRRNRIQKQLGHCRPALKVGNLPDLLQCVL